MSVKKLIVSKFGGTSMQDAVAMRRSAKIVFERGAKIAIVSATSGTTNQLIELAEVATNGRKLDFERLLFQIQERHLAIAQDLNAPESVLVELFEEMSAMAHGLHLLKECSLRAMDKMMALGERLSSVLFTYAMNELTPSKFLDARQIIITDDTFGKGAPQIEQIKAQANQLLANIRHEEITYVSQGFIGATIEGHTTTLGRGGSDYSASLFGEAVGADLIEIWTDVAGIATTDPRLCAEAKPIERITFREAAEMAVFGAKVLHPTTLAPALRANIPVYVGSSFEPEKAGTWICHETEEAPLVRALALKKDQALLTISTPKMLNAYGFLANIFNVFSKHKISVDSITTSEISVSLTVDSPVLQNKPLFTDLQQLAEVQVEDKFHLVSIIGNNLNHTPGVAKKIFSQIEDINVRMMSVGASKHNFCFLVNETDGAEVIKRLHHLFIK